MKREEYYMDMYYELRDDYNHLKSEKLELMAEVERLNARINELENKEGQR
jgi:polyhydroxyalkanoate synthesis regulator phasin